MKKIQITKVLKKRILELIDLLEMTLTSNTIQVIANIPYVAEVKFAQAFNISFSKQLQCIVSHREKYESDYVWPYKINLGFRVITLSISFKAQSGLDAAERD